MEEIKYLIKSGSGYLLKNHITNNTPEMTSEYPEAVRFNDVRSATKVINKLKTLGISGEIITLRIGKYSP